MDPNKIKEMATQIAQSVLSAYILKGKEGAFNRGFGNTAPQKRAVDAAEQILTQHLCQTAEKAA